MFQVVCPECKKRWTVKRKPDLPQNCRTGVYCQFCKTCRTGVIYRRLIRDDWKDRREYHRKYNRKRPERRKP